MKLTFYLSLLAFSFAITQSTFGVSVGPRIGPTTAPDTLDVEQEEEFFKTKMNIPDLRLAIPVLDAGIPESTQTQQEQGIWPELRKAEAVRSAFKLKQWIHRYNQFDSIVIAADTSVSADIYLIGRIVESDSETMRIAYKVVDARGVAWTEERTKKHRVEVGWHERYGNTDQDPFDKLYNEIAEDVYEELKERGKAHVDRLEQNEKLGPEKARYSELQRITTTRDLAFARFVSPEYNDYLEVQGSHWDIQIAPDEESESWRRIQTIMYREDEFAQVIEDHYEGFRSQIEEDYEKWQEDTFPVAREVRLAKRGRTIKAIVGVALVAASVAAAEDGAAKDGDRSAENAVAAGALGGGALIAAAFRDNHLHKQAVEEINELSRSLHNSIRPTRIDLNGKIVTLTGTVQDQFGQWRSMLADIYAQSQDSDAVTILTEEDN
ncbi:MAG: hypothetical protein F4X56_07020 [Gammaproteobacteria bacterium]|nr:hypothetical protein [Gammaproteobacteria bacterium]MYC25650.1 hypothetical protein [Gammaproteobacteria bacterium]